MTEALAGTACFYEGGHHWISHGVQDAVIAFGLNSMPGAKANRL